MNTATFIKKICYPPTPNWKILAVRTMNHKPSFNNHVGAPATFDKKKKNVK